MWSLKLSTASWVLIPVAVGINYIGKMIAGFLKLPLWLDCIGTCLAACLGGPVVGGLSGALNNILYGITLDPISTVYALTQTGIGIAVGYMAYKGKMNTIKGGVLTGIVAGAVAVIISTPLNIIFWDGMTGNIWGDAAFTICIANGAPVWLASFVDEILVDIPDKILVALITVGLFKSLPQNLKAIYRPAEILADVEDF
ncbi:ECF transporter S component [Candidatus Epulonipiscioides gigas]|nr:ECF transporter S component [Epulopiscium sp. SCG-C07WGA-EpuloA2]